MRLLWRLGVRSVTQLKRGCPEPLWLTDVLRHEHVSAEHTRIAKRLLTDREHISTGCCQPAVRQLAVCRPARASVAVLAAGASFQHQISLGGPAILDFERGQGAAPVAR